MWTVINYIKRFVLDLVFSIRFAALEYDDKLRLTKTPRERLIIWIVILTISLVVLYFVVRFLGNMFLMMGRYNGELIDKL